MIVLLAIRHRLTTIQANVPNVIRQTPFLGPLLIMASPRATVVQTTIVPPVILEVTPLAGPAPIAMPRTKWMTSIKRKMGITAATVRNAMQTAVNTTIKEIFECVPFTQRTA